MWTLYNYLAPRVVRGSLPYMAPTACFPLITRDSWKEAFSDAEAIQKLADLFLFEDDICAGAQKLTNRLAYIYGHPPIGEHRGKVQEVPRNDRSLTEENLRYVNKFLVPAASPKPTLSDIERIQALEREVTRQSRLEFPPNADVIHIFTGAPGTGKTFRFLQVGLHHANEACSVLFACYNKVLAADLRRLVTLYGVQVQSQMFGADDEPTNNSDLAIRVVDVFQLALDVYYAHQNLLDPVEDFPDPDAWGRYVVQQITDSPTDFFLTKFDTILIDEAQDMQAWQFELLDLHANKLCTKLFANGIGQELYVRNSDARQKFESLEALGARRQRLNRNFRNSPRVFQLAYTFSETAFDVNKVPGVVAKFLKAATAPVQFDMKGGGLGRVVAIDELVLPPYARHDFNDAVAAQYARLIVEELDRLRDRDEPIDLLILVPDTKSVVNEQVKSALDLLANGTLWRGQPVKYLDYTQDNNRRYNPPNEKIRFCTFHSSRGLEASRVIVFGLEGIERVGAKINVDFRKLAYITLSRSKFDTVIVRRMHDKTVVPFVEQCAAALP